MTCNLLHQNSLFSISYYFLCGINKPSFCIVFLAKITTQATWIPVQSAGGRENTSRPENQDQSINKTFHLVEKALKIGRCAIILCHIHWSLLCCWILFELLAS